MKGNKLLNSRSNDQNGKGTGDREINIPNPKPSTPGFDENAPDQRQPNQENPPLPNGK